MENKQTTRQAGAINKQDILIHDKEDSKQRLIRSEKEKKYILIKGTIHQELLTTINIYVSKIRSPSFTNQTLEGIKGHVIPDIITVGGDFNRYCHS